MFKTPYNYDYRQHAGERNNLPSKTQPSMALSIKELVSRFTRGLPLPTFEPSYNDDFVPDVQHMDFVDRDAYIERNREHIAQLEALAEEAKAKNQPPKPASAASGPRSDPNTPENPNETKTENE